MTSSATDLPPARSATTLPSEAMQIEAITAAPFPIPLIEPFTISRASVDSTRAVLVRATATDGDRTATGYGEAALPLGSAETPGELVQAIDAAAARLSGRDIPSPETLTGAIDETFAGSNPARSGLHAALLDAFARLAGRPVYDLLGAPEALPLVTDITLPIAEPAHRGELAAAHWKRGFRCFKIKVGADLDADQRCMEAVARATPEATLVLDANEGFTPAEALTLLRFIADTGLEVRCFEQPCPRADLAALRAVRDQTGVPIVADESIATLEDLDRLCAAKAVDGVNLKLVKMGGIDRAQAIGLRAKERGLDLMVGAMIESRLGLTAMAHLVSALGGARWVDLDTAFLLASDPYEGGMKADGDRLTLPDSPGLGMEPIDAP
jgi:L-alanine-DL-glutamate epimerase-like enolase superfamily enzyme